MSSFTGKVVVVTAVAHELGEATAKVFAALGARLALCDIDSEGLREVKGVLEAPDAEVMTCIVDLKTELHDLYSCDASVIQNSLDVPVVITLVALAKRLADKPVPQARES